jgi:hypothetical protein
MLRLILIFSFCFLFFVFARGVLFEKSSPLALSPQKLLRNWIRKLALCYYCVFMRSLLGARYPKRNRFAKFPAGERIRPNGRRWVNKYRPLITDERIRPLWSVLICKFSSRERIYKENRVGFPYTVLSSISVRTEIDSPKGNKQFQQTKLGYIIPCKPKATSPITRKNHKIVKNQNNLPKGLKKLPKCANIVM